jgi:hypothetical protein
MASVREVIEWTYKDMKTQWKYCDYKHVTKLRKQPVGKIVLTCMLLRNAHCCLHGSQAALYFLLAPPTLSDWTKQGRKAHSIPPHIIFSNAYEDESDSEISEDGSECDI